MVEIQNDHINPCDDILEHHGKLGMKWGIRRYQPYPDGYSGDGKYIGKLATWKSAKIEKRQARHQAKTNARIRNAVDTGNKKKLKKYQDEMTPDEYEKKYAEAVKNGINNAVKDRDKSALKKYKEDLNKRDYKRQKDRIDFKEAVDKDNSKKTNRLLSKVDPEDVAEATNLIKSRVALQEQKLSKIRQDSELMARMDKLASGLGKVSKISQNAASITSSIMSVNKTITELSKAQKESQDAAEKKKIEKIIKSGNVAKIEQFKSKMTNQQLEEGYKRAYMVNQKAINKAVADGDLTTLNSLMPYMSAKNLSEAIVYIKNMESRGAAFSDENIHDDILEHHGILGMKWGIRRYQPYPSDYKGNGKEVGQAKRISLGDRKYQNYDISYAKAGSQYRKKTKYTNIDGSLNEKGKLHAQKYISKQIDKNEKYYAKEIAKYEKKAEKYKDTNPEMSKKFKDMAKDAARSRDGVNRSIKEMAIDEIMTNESLDNARVMKAIKTAAGVTIGAATGGAVLAGGLGLSSALSTSENFAKAKESAKWELENAKTQFKLSEPIDSVMRITQTSPIAAKSEETIENIIRTYSDARAYVIGIGLDQAVNRMGWLNQQYHTTDKIAGMVGGTGKAALNEMGFTSETISDLNKLVNTTGSTATTILNNPNTVNYINQLANAGNNTFTIPNSGVTINVPETIQTTYGTKSAIDDMVNKALGSSTTATTPTIPRQGDITKRPMNSSVPVSQQRKVK